MGSDSYEVKVWKPERTLVLVGRTGNGKSTTGNSILGEKQFVSKARGKFITQQCQLHTSVMLNGLTVNVIDTPGLFSTGLKAEFTSREILRCLQLAKDGIDAVLLVFSLRNRLTEEEQSTLSTLKILFGRQIVDYIIVVFTNGDALDEGETLEDYLEECPEFQDIIKECGNRKVLFDNRPKISQSEKEKQVQELLDLVKQISNNNNDKSYMADLSLELRENEASFQEKHKQAEVMKGSSSKKEIYQYIKEIENSNKEKLKGMEEKVSNQVKESLKEVSEQLAKAQATREETEKKLTEIHKLSSDEIRRLREQLTKAEKETASLRKELANKCSVL